MKTIQTSANPAAVARAKVMLRKLLQPVAAPVAPQAPGPQSLAVEPEPIADDSESVALEDEVEWEVDPAVLVEKQARLEELRQQVARIKPMADLPKPGPGDFICPNEGCST